MDVHSCLLCDVVCRQSDMCRRMHMHSLNQRKSMHTLKASFFQTWKVSGSKMVGCRISQLGKTPHVSCRHHR